jgi:hypothetical protein
MGISHSVKITVVLSLLMNLPVGCSGPEEGNELFQTECLVPFRILPAELNENSGMIWYGGLIWTINDSDGNPCLYALDTATNAIIKRVRLLGAENIDWEEIAQDESFVYVGDFGNNDGSRKDLRIYKVPKVELEDTLAVPEIIRFSYPDQYDYTPAPYNTPFDCEAMISTGDSLLLFTKNWTGGDTYIYKLPVVEGNYIAIPGGSLNVDGQVTAVAYSAVDHCLYLLGYYNFIPFLCRAEDFIPGKAFDGPLKQSFFTEYFGTQTEGIALSENKDIYISCEKGYGQPALFRVTSCR